LGGILNRSPNRALNTNKLSRNQPKYYRPFWLPASNYYVLTVAASIAFFFIVWGIFHEENAETPLVLAGIGASIILGGAVFLREVVLRNARRNFLLAQKKLDQNINHVSLKNNLNSNVNKITLERNAAILKEIYRKSEAAKVLGKLSDGHLEVFELCNEYLKLSANELKTVGVGSPRLAALRLGRDKISELHHFHLLQWAEIETRAHTNEAQKSLTIADKLSATQKVVSVIESALQYYPNELHLNESKAAIDEFIASVKVSHWMEQAERSAFKGNYKRAISHYRDALFYLGRENVQNEQRQIVADQINKEIEKVRTLENKNNKKKSPSKSLKHSEEKYD
jgi:hypothetical protein